MNKSRGDITILCTDEVILSLGTLKNIILKLA